MLLSTQWKGKQVSMSTDLRNACVHDIDINSLSSAHTGANYVATLDNY